MMKKLIAWLTILILLVALVGCTTANPTTSATAGTTKATTQATTTLAELKTFTYFMPGEVGADYDTVIAEVNQKLVNDGMDFQVRLTAAGWGEWENQINLKLSASEEFDLFVVMNDWIPLDSYIGRNALLPITDYVEKFGANLRRAIPDNVWKGTYYDDEIYGIGCYGWFAPAEQEYITIRKDLWDKYGLTAPLTTDELIEQAALIFEAENNPELVVQAKAFITTSDESLHRSYSTYPFAVLNEIFKVSQNGQVSSWLESDEFKQDCAFWRTLFEKGMVDPDMLSWEDSVRWGNLTAGRAIFDTSNGLPAQRNAVEESGNPDIWLELILLAPNKSVIDYVGARHLNVVPFSSKNPELGVRFFDWVYASQENHDLFVYGIEGRQWSFSDATLTWDGKTVPTIDLLYRTEGNEQLFYSRDFWMCGNLNYKRYTSTEHPQYLEVDDPDFQVVSSPVVGFIFDSTPVVNELSNVSAEIRSVMWPIRYGLLDYNEAFPQALAKIKAAGLDALIAEYQRQFDAYTGQ